MPAAMRAFLPEATQTWHPKLGQKLKLWNLADANHAIGGAFTPPMFDFYIFNKSEKTDVKTRPYS
ncbi:MAG: hypothetical protein WBA92_11110 [Pseudorhodobacter sp.]